jgi:ActR/RegA family two-component response regulator
MRMIHILVPIAAAAVLMTACSNQKEPAEKAVAQTEASLSKFRTEAQQYAPEDLKVVEDSIDRLEAQLASKEYKTVVMQTPNVASSVAELKSTVARKKAEAEEVLAAAQVEWTELSASVPEMLAKVQEKVDSLARSRRVPKGLDKASFEAAKQEFEALKTSWAEAGAEFSSGMVADAVRRGRAAKAKGEELMQKFGV